MASAEVLCIGSELLSGKVNTHIAYLGPRLIAAGLRVRGEATVGDSLEDIRDALKAASARSSVVILCGGLGPTFDDLTREGVAAAFGLKLRYHPGLYARILRQFFRYRMSVPASNKRQAFLLEGASVLPNRRGSAPGQLLRLGHDRIVALLPGPFPEMRGVFEEGVWPLLRKTYGRGVATRRATLRLAGIAESAADMRLKPLLKNPPPWAEYTILGDLGSVELHITVRAPSSREAARRLELLKRRAAARVYGHLYGCDADTLEAAVGRRLKALGWRLAAAESCTGGLLSQRLTSTPGSSDYFLGGTVAYHNKVKTQSLGVREETLRRFGAVSAPCAREMAQGARARFGAELGVAITGIAGPAGGSKAKPVGLVHMALLAPGGASARRFIFSGDRGQVREKAANAALYLLWRRLTGRNQKK